MHIFSPTSKLKGKHLGVVFGGFTPLHIGHLSLIHKAQTETDGVIVIVSGYKEDRGEEVNLPLEKRFRYTREEFKDDPYIRVAKLDEAEIARYPKGWDDWLDKVDQTLSSLSTEEAAFTFYLGEEDYLRELAKRRPEYKTSYTDRIELPISATLIRENPYKYFPFIASSFQRAFVKKYLIAGSASAHKSKSSLMLGREFNGLVSPEYAREYEIAHHLTDEELVLEDFIKFFDRQYEQTDSIVKSGKTKGIVIADTNSTVTMAYADWYLKEELAPEEFSSVVERYKETIKKESWDRIFFFMPQGEYVDDGYRDMTMASEEARSSISLHMLDLYEEAGLGDKITILSGSWSENYQSMRKLILEDIEGR